jgi:hypothetical protein
MTCGFSAVTPRTTIQSSLPKGGSGFCEGPVRCVGPARFDAAQEKPARLRSAKSGS